MQIFYHKLGEPVTIFLEITNSSGERKDPLSTPIVAKIIFPDLTAAVSYPQRMVKLDTGIYTHKFVLPTDYKLFGSYLIDVLYNDPDTTAARNKLYQVVVNPQQVTYSISAV